jgi:hypothetical protein
MFAPAIINLFFSGETNYAMLLTGVYLLFIVFLSVAHYFAIKQKKQSNDENISNRARNVSIAYGQFDSDRKDV